MFSQTVEYAMRAMVQLAVGPSGPATTKDIAEGEGPLTLADIAPNGAKHLAKNR